MTILFSLDQASNVSLMVYDIEGRLVATVADKKMQEGPHSINWDAHSSGGRKLSPGIYLIRIEAGDLKETRKVSLIN
jgi:flagellar hook assembly protein FlgD